MLHQDTSLSSKDLISIAIFSTLFTACFFIIAAMLGIMPAGFTVSVGIAAVPCGIIHMYLRAKTPKRGAVLLQAVLVAMIVFLLGSIWTMPVGILLGGLVAEWISFTGGYKSFWRNTAGYIVLIMGFTAGTVGPIALAKNYYAGFAQKAGITPDYIAAILAFLTGPMFFAVLAMTGICALLGALLGRKMLKKHFVKAGIV